MRIPAATIHNGAWAPRAHAALRSSAGRIAAWSLTLAIAQTALLIGATRTPIGAGAAVALGLAFAFIAAIVVGTTWMLRLAIPLAPRAIGVIAPIAFYGAAALTAPAHQALLAATVLAPAVAWTAWLPRRRGSIVARA